MPKETREVRHADAHRPLEGALHRLLQSHWTTQRLSAVRPRLLSFAAPSPAFVKRPGRGCRAGCPESPLPSGDSFEGRSGYETWAFGILGTRFSI
ncbi:hypothetical protein DSL92_01715 [Billgrantia gudaonensis]|uniref:Uncharacterized protein n=1 Tax=Billgrantia gudaonensis TaxID=376427 RepID=A0A432JL88_9GAMM|nr:hypothetical protein DSL92_01715 [Halomonas gudaonensis]